MSRLRFFAAVLALGLFASLPVQAANIVIVNADSAGEGLNDPTPVAPVGANPGTTLGAQRLNALQHAANIWGGIVESNITIKVQSRFDPLACSLTEADLGFGGPIASVTLTVPAAIPNTWYPIALGNKIRNTDINFFLDEVQLTITTQLDTGCAFPRTWYYGLDGAGDPGTTLDVVTVALREIGHGIGFNTLVDVSTGARFDDMNDIFMLLLEDLSTGKTWGAMSNAERAASAINTGNLVWSGPRVTASAGILSSGTNSGKVIMHAPNPAEPGFTGIHWDPSVTPDELMEPSPAGALYDPSLARALLADLGWTLETCGNGSVDIGEYCDSALECCTALCDIAVAGTSCDDGSFCNGTETCDAFGGCTGPSTGDPCPAMPVGANCSQTCDENLDGCFAPFPDGSTCDDLDICTAASECLAGVCVGDESVNLCTIDPYMSYKSRAPRRDPLGQSIINALEKPWVIKIDDFHLPNASIDDPENFEVGKAASVLNPALQNLEVNLLNPTLRYLRYQMKSGKEGTGDVLANGRYPKPARHVARKWELSNALGTINITTSKVQAFLLPAATGDNPGPTPPGDESHFACYKVKVTRDVTDQTPDTGVGLGKLRKDQQAFFLDPFDDCALNAAGGPSFASTPVEGRCLFDLGRVAEFCSPINKSPIDPPRSTAATIAGTTLTKTDLGLLCYQAKPAAKITNANVAGILGDTVGERILPKQLKHVKRGFKTGNPVFTGPSNDFDAPVVMETTKLETVCLPTSVLSVNPL